MADHGESATGSVKWVTVEVAVVQEPSNEADPWVPPSAREVAAFLQQRASHAETDDGWFVSVVVDPADAEQSDRPSDG